MNQRLCSTVLKRGSLAIVGMAILALPDVFISTELANVGPAKASSQHGSSKKPRQLPLNQAPAATCTSIEYTVSSSEGLEIVPAADDIGNHGDNLTTEITLPFPYKLYDQTFTTAKVSSNGVLQFVSDNPAGDNTCVPNADFDYAIFAHWDDLCTTGDCAGDAGAGEGVEYGIFTSTFGEVGDQVFVIEWRAVYADLVVPASLGIQGAASQQTGNFANFEIRLFEGQRKFDIIYGTLTEQGCSATVGVQKDTGSCFTEYLCNPGCEGAQTELRTAAIAGLATNLTSGLRLTFEVPVQCTLTCSGNIEAVAPQGQCGAPVEFSLPSPSGNCDEVVCADAEGNTLNSGDFFFVGTTLVVCNSADAACSFNIIVTEDVPPLIECSADRVVSNDPGQCGATVSFTASATDNCSDPAVSCDPQPGFFPVGTTSVTCTAIDTSGNTATCSFMITVNDTQPPAITCPPNQTAKTPTINNTCAVANFTAAASDNCPGVVVVCNPPSGSCFPVGTTNVTCTATDASMNTATCSFTVTVFNVCLQDDSNPSTVFLGNIISGAYRFCCGGTIFTGVAQVTRRGNIVTFQHYAPDRRVLATDDEGVFRGTASIQSPPGSLRCAIADRDTRNNGCLCP